MSLLNSVRPRPAYFVKGGHTLGYIYDERPDVFWVLRGSVLRGGHANDRVPLGPWEKDALVPATAEDFDAFMVSSAGHIE